MWIELDLPGPHRDLDVDRRFGAVRVNRSSRFLVTSEAHYQRQRHKPAFMLAIFQSTDTQ